VIRTAPRESVLSYSLPAPEWPSS